MNILLDKMVTVVTQLGLILEALTKYYQRQSQLYHPS